jgi:hypothetical protein
LTAWSEISSFAPLGSSTKTVKSSASAVPKNSLGIES